MAIKNVLWAILVCLTILILDGVRPVFAQVSDVSDGFWSIVMPEASAVDVEMGPAAVNTPRDTAIVGFIRNSGSVAIRIDSIVFAGTHASAFSLASGIPPFEVEGGEEPAVEFRFVPQTAGEHTAEIRVHTQIGVWQQAIRGEGVEPVVSLETELIDFGQVMVGSTKDTTVNVTLRNIGTENLQISGARILGDASAPYGLLAGNEPRTLLPNEAMSLSLRYAPVVWGRSSRMLAVYHDGPFSPAVITLFGDALVERGTAVLGIDTVSARAGAIVEVPLRLLNASKLAGSGARGFYAELSFDASLLAPTGNTPTGLTVGEKRIIPLNDLPLQADAQGIVSKLQFIAMLGTVEGTALELSNVVALDGYADVTPVPGYFKLSDICREGGTRKYIDGGSLVLHQNRPNPFNAETLIEFEVIEGGITRLSIMDLLGRTVVVLVDDVLTPGKHSALFDASAFPSGLYMAVLVAPSEHRVRTMEVLK